MAKKMTKKAASKKTDDGALGGFTIIEVVLVLAIAGLIFMMVFIALPALQRSQRDTQRRDDIGKVTQAMMNYATNNNGKLPGDGVVPTYEQDDDGGQEMTSLPSCGGGVGATRNGAACLIRGYLNSTGATRNEFGDPLGWDYGLEIVPFSDYDEGNFDGEMDYTIYVYKGAKCEGEFAKKSENSRDYAVMYRLEGSGTYCHDNGS